MQLNSIIITISLILFQTSDIEKFEKEYKFDIEKAFEYYSEFKADLNTASTLYSTDVKIIGSVVFPELVRYSKYRDFLETKVLEMLYINGGKESADFSIGKFQMKPSFIEKMETYIKSHQPKLQKYQKVSLYNETTDESIRAQRLERLKSKDWQIIYINCFYTIVDQRFSSVDFTTTEDKIRFFATAYNHGFDKSKEDILKWKDQKCFPYGTSAKNSEQYKYADVAVYFYEKKYKSNKE